MLKVARLPILSLAAYCLVAISACSLLPKKSEREPAPSPARQLAPDPNAPRFAPLTTKRYTGITQNREILGDVQIVFARHENTLADFARTYGVGYQAVRGANPGTDPWLPGAGTPVFLPTMHVVPNAPREGVVINLPSMRLLYFSDDDGAGEARTQDVSSYAIGIGREGWATPIGTARVTQKKANPNWYPPVSVREEHAAMGDPLPKIVPPGPDNPLGKFKMRLSMPGYLIHGTNKPAGVGMRISHGCIRLYPEDIATLFDLVPSQTPVVIVDQPALAGWRDGELYLEVHPPLAEDKRSLQAEAERVIELALARAARTNVALNPAAILQIVVEQRGIPFPILAQRPKLDHYLRTSRIVKNTIAGELREETASR